jgi:glutamyl-tRNA synthetase
LNADIVIRVDALVIPGAAAPTVPKHANLTAYVFVTMPSSRRISLWFSGMRTRFAPSPTGFLHVGGARTALFCYLQARANNGVFILRIEDTDLERSTAESVQAILDGLAWLELDYDEGPSHRPSVSTVTPGGADPVGPGQGPHRWCRGTHRGRARNDEAGPQAALRRPLPRRREPVPGETGGALRNPQDGDVVFDDLVRGRISISNTADDLVIAPPDGAPDLNFTVVVDDIDMAVSLVIRGDDHINNTPRQINIYRALGAALPDFAHVPMILGDDGARLSKRHGAVGVLQYRDDGYLPQALLNYLVRLGWSHGDQEIFSREEMIAHFDIRNVNRKAAAFNTEKLDWLNQHYMKTLPPGEVSRHLAWHFEQAGIDPASGPPLEDLVAVQADRVKTLKEMCQSRMFYGDLTTTMARRRNICVRSPSSPCGPSAIVWPIWPTGSRRVSTRPSASPPSNWSWAWVKSPSRCAWP